MEVRKTIIPEVPNGYLIALLVIGLVTMRIYGVDSFTTAGLSLIIGYVTGKHIEQTKRC